MILIMRFSLPITTTSRYPLLKTSLSGLDSFFINGRGVALITYGYPGILFRTEIGIPALNRARCSLLSWRG